MTTNGGSEDDAHDVETERSAARRSWTDTPRPSVEIVETVADVTERDPMTMPQLNDYIDPDALDKLLGSAVANDAAPAHVSFEYVGVRVTVDSTGAVTVEQ